MKTLPIVWQRLANTEGRTCPRCHGTGDEVLSALDRLRAALAPLGVEPQLETRAERSCLSGATVRIQPHLDCRQAPRRMAGRTDREQPLLQRMR